MTSANIERDGKNIRYNYSCCAFKIPVCNMMVKLTNWTYFDSDDMFSIYHHPIDCGKFGFIKSFQFESNQMNTRYSFACCEVFDQKWKEAMQCTTNATKFLNHTGYNKTLQLAEVPVSCNAGFGLSSLKMKLDFLNNFQWGFEFRCCKVAY